MKKIGKLIELLNEYIEENKPKTNLVKEITDGGYFVNNRNDGDGFLCETIMSKQFGFIKWLVENDKIDLEKAHYKFEGTTVLKNCIREEYGRYKWLLMLLSISDTPIDFLCEILK